MKLSLSFFLAAALSSSSVSAKLRGNNDLKLDMTKILAAHRQLQVAGACYDINVHVCSCDADRCSQEKCDGIGGIWSAQCPDECTECGADEPAEAEAGGEPSEFVESDVCTGPLMACTEGAPCFDHGMICQEDGTFLVADCNAAIACKPCYPYSRCGTAPEEGEEDDDGSIVNTEGGLVMTNDEGTIMANDEGIVVADNDGNVIMAGEDGIILTSPEGTITIGKDSITLTDANGEVYDISDAVVYDEATETYSLTDEETGEAISFNEDGFMAVDADGSFISGNSEGIVMGNEDGIILADNDGGVIMADEDGIILTSPDGTITIGKDSITLTDANGEVYDISDAVVYDEATETYSLTDEATGEAIYFNEDGFMAVDADGSFIGANSEGIAMGNEDGVIAAGTDGFMVGNEDGVIFSDAEGSITVSEDSIIFYDTETDESITIMGEVKFDETTGIITLTGDEASISIDTNTMIVTLTNADGFSTTVSYTEKLVDEDEDDDDSDELSVTVNDSGSITITGPDGSMDITDGSITFTNNDGETLIVKGEVTYDETSESFTVSNDDGIITLGPDGLFALGPGGFIMGDEEGMIMAGEDGIIIAGEEGSITITENSITFTDVTGVEVDITEAVVYDEATGVYTLVFDDGVTTLTFNEEGFTLSGEDGFIAGNDEGLLIANDEGIIVADNDGGMIMAGEDGIVLTGPDGTITIGKDSITLTDANGEVYDISDAVVYDEATETYSITDEATGEAIYFNEDGFMAVDADGSFIGANSEGFTMGNEDGVIFAGDAGSITVSETSIVFYDTEFDETIVIEGDVTFDDKSGIITLTSPDVTISIDTATMDVTLTNADGFSTTIAYDESTDAPVAEEKLPKPKPPAPSDPSILDAVDDNGGCLSISDAICGNDNYSVLCNLLTSNSGMFALLAEYTLFAPSDAAFAAISGPLETLNEDTVRDVLMFHVATGAVKAADMPCGGLLPMVNGSSSRHSCQRNAFGVLEFIQKGGGNRKNNIFPKIVSADIEACEGIIHAVDNVLLPNYIDQL